MYMCRRRSTYFKVIMYKIGHPSPDLGIDLVAAFYGCLYVGAVPVPIRPPHPQNLITTLPTVRSAIILFTFNKYEVFCAF